HIVGARRTDHDVGLLDTELEVAARQEEGHRAGAAAGANGLRFERFGETELLDPLGDVLAAAPARVADRLRGQERCPIVLDRTDVRFWRAGAHRDAKTGEHVGRYRGGHDLVLLGEIVHRLRTKRNQVGRTAAGPLLERVPGLLEHRYLVAAPARAARD